MFATTIAQTIGLHKADVERLLAMPPQSIYHDAEFQSLVQTINADTLYESIAQVRQHLDAALPPLVNQMMATHHIEHFPLTSYMFANWMIGFLHYPQELWRLIEKHADVPVALIREATLEVLPIFGALGKRADEWQAALAILAIPLASDAR